MRSKTDNTLEKEVKINRKNNPVVSSTQHRSSQEPIARSEEIPILGLCQGVFTGRFILEQFFPRNWKLPPSMSAFEV